MIPTYLRHSTQPAHERVRDYIESCAIDSNSMPLARVRAVVDPHIGTEEWSNKEFTRLLHLLGFAMMYFGGKPYIVLNAAALTRPPMLYNRFTGRLAA